MKGLDVACQQIVEWVTDYLEGAVDPEQKRLLEEHLAGCDGCTRYIAQIKTTMELLGEVSDDDLSNEAWATLREAFRNLSRD
jgi:anti-sigma factor RsiW